MRVRVVPVPAGLLVEGSDGAGVLHQDAARGRIGDAEVAGFDRRLAVLTLERPVGERDQGEGRDRGVEIERADIARLGGHGLESLRR